MPIRWAGSSRGYGSPDRSRPYLDGIGPGYDLTNSPGGYGPTDYEAARIRHMTIATYQAVSGTGKRAMEELRSQSLALLQDDNVHSSVYLYLELLPLPNSGRLFGWTL